MFVADHGVQTVRDHVQLHAPGQIEIADRLRQKQQAVETRVLRVLHGFAAGRGRASARYGPQMNDIRGPLLPALQRLEQRVIVGFGARIDHVVAIAARVKRQPGPHADDVAKRLKLRLQLRAHPALVQKHQPLRVTHLRGGFRLRAALPRWHIEPVVDVGAFARGRRCGRRLDRRPRVNPVTLAFKRIRRQRHAPSRLMRVNTAPVDRHARQPQLAQRVENERLVGARLLRVTQRRADAGGRRGFDLLARQPAQRLTRPDFQQHRVGLFQQFAHTVAEAHRLSQMPRPVLRIDRLRRGDPSAGDVGNEGPLRRLQRDGLELIHKFCQDRRHHRRVKRM